MAYFSYDTDTGALIQVSDFEITDVVGHDNYAISSTPLSKLAIDAEYQWDIVSRDFVVKSTTTLTKLEFLRRFTSAERIAIREIAKTNPIVNDAMELLNMAEFVSLYDADTQMLVGYLAQLGIILPNRISEILT